jgi:hypothetical protein
MSRPFAIQQMERNTVSDIEAMWLTIDLDPAYQRISDIWPVDKRQLFIDSLINGYDIPKLYFHDLGWGPASRSRRYAIIDGKQRLQAIHAFMAGEFRLSDDFEDMERYGQRVAGAAAGKTYGQLALEHPDLKARLDTAELPIVVVVTVSAGSEDLEIIEEMFSRLNEAVPLNAPEKRNALGGPLPAHIRRLARNEFFTARLLFDNGRYRYLDLSTKFLYMAYRKGLPDIKKRALDDFVKDFKKRNLSDEAEGLAREVTPVLATMTQVFEPKDQLLRSVGMITIYFYLFSCAGTEGWLGDVGREPLLEFDRLREVNKTNVKRRQELALLGEQPKELPAVNSVLTLFERYVQSPNDSKALTERYRVLSAFLRTKEMPGQWETKPLAAESLD